jgi:Uncharacterized protein conserved in bacteria (DUF2252)
MDVIEATAAYERWLRERLAVAAADLRHKHDCMDAGLFAFFRATFYRWVPLWRDTCPGLLGAPQLLAVGDLHVENFGSWRDAEGRLVWGLNDADEAARMPYTVDLVRLATSALLGKREDHLAVRASGACEAILDGYIAGLKSGGEPFVLEEEHPILRAWAMSAERAPPKFWAKLNSGKPITAPAAVRQLLAANLPDPRMPFRIVHRVAGLGSLGRPRFVALASWDGGYLAREAKATLPSAYGWALGRVDERVRGGDLLRNAIRCPDPHLAIRDGWVIRRLAPHCSRIELSTLPEQRDEDHLLHAMGRETANLHLGTREQLRPILRDLGRRKDTWLIKAARAMAEATRADWKHWRSRRGTAA